MSFIDEARKAKEKGQEFSLLDYMNRQEAASQATQPGTNTVSKPAATQQPQTPAGVQTYLDWNTDFDAFAEFSETERKAREGTYQSADSFSNYAAGVAVRAGDMLRRTDYILEDFEKNRSTYDQMFGEGTTDDAIASMNQRIQYLNSVSKDLEESKKYWDQFASEDEYNAAIAQGNRQEYLASFDIDAGKQIVADLQKQRNALAQQTFGSTMGQRGSVGADLYDGQKEKIAELDKQITSATLDVEQAQALKNKSYYDTLSGRRDFDSFSAWGSSIRTIDDDLFYGNVNYDMMSEEEKGVYHYLLAKKDSATRRGDKTAVADYERQLREYLFLMEGDLNKRQGEKEAEFMKGLSPIPKFFAQTESALDSGLSNYLAGLRQHAHEGAVAPGASQFAYEDFTKGMGFLEKAFYGAVQQTGQNAIPMLSYMMPGGGFIQPILTGVSAAGNAYSQGLSMGMTKKQAKTYGSLVGTSEAILEKLLNGFGGVVGAGPEKLLEKVSHIESGFVRAILTAGINIGSEEIEELSQTFLEPMFSSVIMDTEYDAPTWEEIAYTAAVTFLSTGASNMGNVAQAAGKNGYVPKSADANNAYDLETEAETPFAKGLGEQETAYTPLGEETTPLQEMPQNEPPRAISEGDEILRNAAMEMTDLPAEENAPETDPREAPVIQSTVTGPAMQSTTVEANSPLSAAAERPAEIQTVDAAEVSAMADTLGTLGKSQMTEMYLSDMQAAEEYIPAFISAYRAGQQGTELPASSVLTQNQREMAYLAGQIDSQGEKVSVASNSQLGYNESIYDEIGTEGQDGQEGRVLHLRNSGQWAGSADSAIQVSGMEESAGRNQSRKTTSISADSGTASLTYGKEVSTASLGITGGSRKNTIRLVTGGDTIATATARRVAKQRGLRAVFFSGNNLEIKQTVKISNGTTKKEIISARAFISGDRVFVRVDHPKYTADQLMRHEAGHDMIAKGEVNPNDVRERIEDIFGKNKLDELSRLYVEAYEGTGLTSGEIWEEVICDSLGDMNIFADTLREELAQELLDVTKAAVETTRKDSARAPPSATDTDVGRAKFSIEYDTSNTPYVVVSTDILAGVPKSQWIATVKGVLARKYPNGVHVGNEVIKINRQSRREMTFSQYTQWLARNDTSAYTDKLRTADNADEIILASRGYINEGRKHARKDNIRDFARGTVLLRVGENDYTAEVVVGTTIDGDMLLYDIVNLQRTQINEKSKRTVPPTKKPSDRSGTPASDTSIDKNGSDVNGKFSMESPAEQTTGLQGETDGTTTRNSLEEDLKNGRARKESAEEFKRRGVEEGFRVLESRGIRYGFRRAGDSLEGGPRGRITREAQDAQRELTAFGIPADIIDGPVLRNHNGITTVKGVQEAVTINHFHVVINKDTTISPLNVTGHEAFHFWKSGVDREAYMDVVQDNLLFTSEEFLEFQSKIARAYLGEEADLADSRQRQKLFEEIVAYISGDIHEGTNDAHLRPMLRDLDAVKTAWNELVERNRKEVKFSRELENVEFLREQNEALREKAEYWKEQTKRTTAQNRTVRKGDVENLARHLIKSYGSTLTAADITGDLQALGNFLVRGGDGENDLTWHEMKDRAVMIARDIIDNAEQLNDGAYRQYADLRNYLHNTDIVYGKEYHGDIPDFAEFRKSNFGKLNLKTNGRTNLDSVYEELCERWPEFFDRTKQTHPTDQLLHIIDVLDSLRPVYENPFSYHMAEAVEYVANDIIDSLLSEDIRQTPPTFADRQAAKLDSQKAKDRQKLDRLRQQKNERIAEIRRQGQERTREALRKIRADRDAKITAIKEHYRIKEAKSRESRRAAELRKKIQRHVKELSSTLLRPSDKHHVPDALRGPVARLLEAINLESNYELEYGRDARYHRVKPGESLYSEATKRTQAFAELRMAYAEIAGELVIDPDLLGETGLLNEVAAMRDKTIAEMNTTELEIIWQTIRAVEASIRSANRMFAAARFRTVSELAEALRRDNAGKKEKSEYNYIGWLQKLTSVDMLTPEAFLHRLGDGGDVIFRMMRNAQDEHIRIMKEISDFTHKALNDVNVRALETELHRVTLGGQEITLSTAQLMELYALMRREQARAHILIGGILPDDISTKGLKMETHTDPIGYITMEEVGKALSLLTAEQIAITEKLQDYTSTTLSDFGNKASMEVYNYKKFTEEYYWPIRSNKQETNKTVEKDTATTSVANRGFTKATTPNSNTSVRLGSIFDTFSTHASEMATYAAWLGTSEDINRIRNFTFRDGEGRRMGTVEGIIDRVHGKEEGSAYLQKLLSDIANGVKGTHGETDYTGGLVGNYKAASVGANLRVIIQQPTAILRALDMIDPQYLMAGIRPGGWEKALQYAPIAQWKDWGYFDINTGRQMKDVLFDSDSKLEKVRQASMWMASKMDSLAWGQLWNAVEAETKAKRKELKPGTKEFYDAVAERFTEIIDRTQVVDGILQRSQIMRSNSGLTKMVTSFMGEPMKQYNMLLSSAYDARHAAGKEQRTTAKKRLARTAVALSVSGVVNAMVQSIVDALRDDDKEKDYWEKWLTAFTGFTGEEEGFLENMGAFWSGNLESIINLGEYIPYVKDVVSLIQGYDVSRMDMDSIQDTIAAVQNMFKAWKGEGKHTIAAASANLFAVSAKLLGIPVANFKRDVKAIAMTAAIESDNYLMQYRMEKAALNMNYQNNRKTFLDILYHAYTSDREAYELIYADMVSSGFDPEKIRSGMEDRMKADQGVNSVSDLDDRYLSPDDKRLYDEKLAPIQKSSVWKKAGQEGQEKLESDLYDLIAENGNGKKLQEKIDGGASYGLDEGEYLLYRLALSITDKPSEKGKYGTYTGDEVEQAIRMLQDLSDDERDYLWIAAGKNQKTIPDWDN